jgi:hypothetical protein
LAAYSIQLKLWRSSFPELVIDRKKKKTKPSQFFFANRHLKIFCDSSVACTVKLFTGVNVIKLFSFLADDEAK